MSTQAARNIIKSQLEQVISTAKTRIKDEGRKKLVELKQQIPTPSELVKKLETEINVDTCSPEGIAKFNRKFKEIEDKLKVLENISSQSYDKLTEIETKLNSY